MSSYTQAKLYATSLADRFIRLELLEFFKNVHQQFYQDIDIKFMEYFLSIAQREGELVVHHETLREYGVMTSENSAKAHEKMLTLGLKEGVDFELADIRQLRSQGGTSNKSVYHLTPEAFKKCLMRARRYKNQPVDPVIYVDYYLLLEKIFGLYRDYQAAYQERVISTKDDKIDILIREVAEQKQLVVEQKEMAITQNDKMDKLLDHAEDVTSRLDSLFDFTSTFAQTTLSTWIGSLVFKSQLDQLIKTKDLAYALKHLKVMFTVAFYRVVDERTEFAIYFCCTNFADLNKRIRDLYNRHAVEGMVMLKPQVICLISQEINCERAKLQQLVLDNDASFAYNNRRHYSIQQKYDQIVEMVRKENFQGYQARRDQIVSDNSEVNGAIVSQMVKSDATFFSSSLPRCQEYLDCAITRDAHGYKPVQTVSRKTTLREDLNERMTDTMYALRKLHTLLGDDGGVQEIQKMIRKGIVTKRDLKSLMKLGKAAAAAENVVLSKEEEAQVAEVEALPDDAP